MTAHLLSGDSLPAVQGLSFAQDGPVLTVRLDSPEGNLMTMDMCDALVEVLSASSPA